MLQRWMKRNVISARAGMTLRQAAGLIVEHHIGALPVVDGDGKYVGLVRLQDILGVFLPDFVALLGDIDFVHDFGVLETFRPEDEARAERLTVRELMQPPVGVQEDCGLLRALATINTHALSDLPVVDAAGRLVGIVSRVDIAVAFLSTWTGAEIAP